MEDIRLEARLFTKQQAIMELKAPTLDFSISKQQIILINT